MQPRPAEIELILQAMHKGQLAAHWALKPYRFKALRCGRRFGKTEYAKTWIAEALIKGWECAWFAPQHKTSAETFSELTDLLRPILRESSKGSGVLRLITGGRLDLRMRSPVVVAAIAALSLMKLHSLRMATPHPTGR
jgi:hypothetical protein